MTTKRARIGLVGFGYIGSYVYKQITAQGKGVAMKIERSNPLKGVSGVFTLHSTLAAISRAKGAADVMQIC